MRILDASRYALTSCVAVALLAGCGGPQPPIGGPGAIVNAALSARPSLGRGGLVYASLPYAVSIYTYPKGKLYGSISIPVGAHGICTDKAGNVFVTEDDGHVVEYSHGATKPTASVQLQGTPHSCAFDDVTGNVAISNGNGSLAVFAKFPGEPTLYNTPDTGALYFCTYDGHGNLFVDGQWFQRDKFRNGLLELVKGGSSLIPVKLPFGVIRTAAGIQWDGDYLAVQALRNDHTFDRVSVHDFHGQVVSTVRLSGKPSYGSQFVFEDARVIKPGAFSKDIGFWPYPAGGAAQKRIKHVGDREDRVYGVTISFVPK